MQEDDDELVEIDPSFWRPVINDKGDKISESNENTSVFTAINPDTKISALIRNHHSQINKQTQVQQQRTAVSSLVAAQIRHVPKVRQNEISTSDSVDSDLRSCQMINRVSNVHQNTTTRNHVNEGASTSTVRNRRSHSIDLTEPDDDGQIAAKKKKTDGHRDPDLKNWSQVFKNHSSLLERPKKSKDKKSDDFLQLKIENASLDNQLLKLKIRFWKNLNNLFQNSEEDQETDASDSD